MQAGIHNILIEQGAHFELPIQWKVDTVPVDLTGYSARMQIRENFDSLLITASLTSVVGGGIEFTDPEEGKLLVTIPGTLSQNFTLKTGVYDLELVAPSGKITRLLQGTYSLSPEVTK